MMFRMDDIEFKVRRGWPMAILLLLEALVLGLFGLHLLSSRWTVAAFFAIIIPYATLLAFARWCQP